MPQTVTTPNLLQRLTAVEKAVAALQRADRERDELPFYPTDYQSMAYTDASASFETVWETTFTPRTAAVDLGIVAVGDQVGSTNTGGEWQILIQTDVVMSGDIPATFTYQLAREQIDLTPYQQLTQVHIQIQARRTSGASSGGKFGAGGAVGISPQVARLI